jgi:hypothetical protein
MKMSFQTPSDKFVAVKGFIRTYESFRFITNPQIIGETAYFYISGDVEDVNSFLSELYNITCPQAEPPNQNFFQKLFSFWT